MTSEGARRSIVLALRRLWRTPGELPAFACTLALGLALVVVSWAVLEATLREPFRFDAPDRIVRLWDSREPFGHRILQQRDFRALRDRRPTAVTGLAAYAGVDTTVGSSRSGDALRLRAAVVTAGTFRVLGVDPVAGRLFGADDERPTEAPAVIVSARLKDRGVDATPGAVVDVDGVPHRVVGVMARDIWFPDRDTQVWLPSVFVDTPGVTTWSRQVIARLALGASPQLLASQAAAVLDAAGRDARIAVQDYVAAATAGVRAPVLLLNAGALMMLLLVCVNAGGLLVLRAHRQRTAFAIESALGGHPRRLAATYAVEIIVVSLCVAPLTVIVADAVLHAAAAADPSGAAWFSAVRFDWTTWLVAVAAAVTVTGLTAVPACGMVMRTAAAQDLLCRTTSHVARRGSRMAFVAIQSAVVCTLAVNAAELTWDLRALVRANVGLGNTDFWSMRVDMPAQGRDVAAEIAALMDTVDGLDGAGTATAVTTALPLGGRDEFRNGAPAGRTMDEERSVAIRYVSPGFFGIAGIEVLAGRELQARDRDVAAVDSTLAAAFFGGAAGALGSSVRLGQTRWPIVGIVEGVGHQGLFDAHRPTAYLPMWAWAASATGRTITAYVATAGGRGAAESAARVRAAVRAALPDADIEAPRAFRDSVLAATGGMPLLTWGATAFCGLAVALVAAGIYGLTNRLIVERSREIAIRVALGASPWRVAGDVCLPLLAASAFGVVAAAGAFLAAPGALDLPGVMKAASTPERAIAVAAALVVVVCVMTCAAALPVARAFTRPVDGVLRAD